ncbi:Hsp70 family protein [Candidatus Saccharibacteria bacterium]|nr:Hsp70 family protein [Candidatus Saccharibacteria bacterium]
MSRIIGIDFGSTNTVVACLIAGKPVVISDKNGNESFPSMVAVKEDGGSAVGCEAQKGFILKPTKTFFGLKRLLGSKPNEKEIVNNPGLVFDKESTCAIINGKKYSLELLSAAILLKAKRNAERFLNETIDGAIVTVPAYFNIAQRHAVKKSGELAGLNIRRIISEPTAAAMAYGFLATENKVDYHDEPIGEVDGKLRVKRRLYGSSDSKIDGRVMVIDFGGGTFDVSVVDVGDGVYEVMSTCGDTRLGGEDFDSAIAKFIMEDIKDKYRKDLKNDFSTFRRILDAAKTAKESLSSCDTVEISIPYLFKEGDNIINYNHTLTKTALQGIVKGLLSKMDAPIEKALRYSQMQKNGIDKVILVGGMTRMPMVRNRIKDFFKKEPFYGINPNTAVAVGAAIQGSVLEGDLRDVLLLDVLPLTLGIETQGGVRTPLIGNNTTIPTSVSEIFTPADKKSTSVNVHIIQGEREFAKDNVSLGYITIDDLNPDSEEEQRIKVTFSIDANGILHVSANNLETGKMVTIVANGDIETEEKTEYGKKPNSEAHPEPKKNNKHWWNK